MIASEEKQIGVRRVTDLFQLGLKVGQRSELGIDAPFIVCLRIMKKMKMDQRGKCVPVMEFQMYDYETALV